MIYKADMYLKELEIYLTLLKIRKRKAELKAQLENEQSLPVIGWMFKGKKNRLLDELDSVLIEEQSISNLYNQCILVNQHQINMIHISTEDQLLIEKYTQQQDHTA